MNRIGHKVTQFVAKNPRTSAHPEMNEAPPAIYTTMDLC
jgi:hypothetical protein